MRAFWRGCIALDFLLKDSQIVVETKITRKTLKDRDIGNQLIEDIARYKEHPDCHFLSCFIYDPEGYLSNPSGVENDLNKQHDGLKVEVKIEPK